MEHVSEAAPAAPGLSSLLADPALCVSVLTAALLALYVWGMWGFDRFSSQKLPCLPARPFCGAATPFFLRSRDFHTHVKALYSRVRGRPLAGLYHAHRPVILLRDPRLVRRALVDAAAAFPLRAPPPLPAAHALLDKHMLRLPWRRWRAARRELDVALLARGTAPVAVAVAEAATRLADTLDLSAARLPPSAAVEVRGPLERFWSESLGALLLGVEPNAAAAEAFHRKRKALADAGRSPAAFLHALWLRAAQMLKIRPVPLDLENYFNDVAHKMKEQVKKSWLLEDDNGVIVAENQTEYLMKSCALWCMIDSYIQDHTTGKKDGKLEWRPKSDVIPPDSINQRIIKKSLIMRKVETTLPCITEDLKESLKTLSRANSDIQESSLKINGLLEPMVTQDNLKIVGAEHRKNLNDVQNNDMETNVKHDKLPSESYIQNSINTFSGELSEESETKPDANLKSKMQIKKINDVDAKKEETLVTNNRVVLTTHLTETILNKNLPVEESKEENKSFENDGGSVSKIYTFHRTMQSKEKEATTADIAPTRTVLREAQLEISGPEISISSTLESGESIPTQNNKEALTSKSPLSEILTPATLVSQSSILETPAPTTLGLGKSPPETQAATPPESEIQTPLDHKPLTSFPETSASEILTPQTAVNAIGNIASSMVEVPARAVSMISVETVVEKAGTAEEPVAEEEVEVVKAAETDAAVAPVSETATAKARMVHSATAENTAVVAEEVGKEGSRAEKNDSVEAITAEGATAEAATAEAVTVATSEVVTVADPVTGEPAGTSVEAEVGAAETAAANAAAANAAAAKAAAARAAEAEAAAAPEAAAAEAEATAEAAAEESLAEAASSAATALAAQAAEGGRRGALLVALALRLLAQHPVAQRRAAADAQRASKRGDRRAPYIDAVIAETLRLWPAEAVVGRACVGGGAWRAGAPLAGAGVSVGVAVAAQPGDALWVPAAALHTDAQFWTRPTEFLPERFLPVDECAPLLDGEAVPEGTGEGCNAEGRGVYLPFGLGPRACAGREIVLLLAREALVSTLSRLEFHPPATRRLRGLRWLGRGPQRGRGRPHIAKWSYSLELEGKGLVWLAVKRRQWDTP